VLMSVIVGMLVTVIVLVMMPASVIVFSFFCHFPIPQLFPFTPYSSLLTPYPLLLTPYFLLLLPHPFHDLPLLVVDLHDG